MPSSPIFRHIEIAQGKKVVLGEPFTHADISLARGQHDRELRKGTFGEAESIVIELTASGIVRGMRFSYAAGTSRREMADGYKEMLGSPAIEEPARVVWEDGHTRFELCEGAGPHSVVTSHLADRGLAD